MTDIDTKSWNSGSSSMSKVIGSPAASSRKYRSANAYTIVTHDAAAVSSTATGMSQPVSPLSVIAVAIATTIATTVAESAQFSVLPKPRSRASTPGPRRICSAPIRRVRSRGALVKSRCVHTTYTSVDSTKAAQVTSSTQATRPAGSACTLSTIETAITGTTTISAATPPRRSSLYA